MLTFLKNRDLIFRKIKSIDEMEGSPGFKVTYADYVQEVISSPSLEDSSFDGRDKNTFFALVCYNTRQNFDYLISRWETLKGFQHLTIYFINPFTEGENKWIIRPYNHALIADAESFQTGLQSMFSMVEPVREQDLKRTKD